MSRHGNSLQYTAPGARPWLFRGTHPLQGPAPATAPPGGGPSSQLTAAAADTGSRPINVTRPVAIPLPHFAFNAPQPHYFTSQHYSAPLSQQQIMQAAQLVAQPAAVNTSMVNARGLRFSQPSASQPQAAFPSWSQLDSMLVGEQTQDSMQLDAAAVGSAPHPAPSDTGYAPSQPEFTALGAAPAQTATRLLNEISKKGLNLDAHPVLVGLSTKMEVVDGRQSNLAASVDQLKDGLAQQGDKLEGIAQTCTQLLQVVQAVTAASSGITERLQALLAKEQPCVTIIGEMATQTSPVAEQRSSRSAALTAAVEPVPADLLQAYSQRRASAADAPYDHHAALHKHIMPHSATDLRHGLHAAAPAMRSVPSSNMPTTFALLLAPTSRRSTRQAAAARAQQSPAGTPAAAATSFSRKRQLDADGEYAPASASRQKPAAATVTRLVPCQWVSKQRSQAPAVGQAEALFDSLFAGEEEEGGKAKTQQKPAFAATQQAAAGGDSSDLAAAVQARLQRHKNNMAQSRRRRTSLSRRQQEEDEE